jgi:hypothetical protein
MNVEIFKMESVSSKLEIILKNIIYIIVQVIEMIIFITASVIKTPLCGLVVRLPGC